MAARERRRTMLAGAGLVVLVLMAIGLGLVEACLAPRRARTLRVGMTRSEIEGTLGSPTWSGRERSLLRARATRAHVMYRAQELVGDCGPKWPHGLGWIPSAWLPLEQGSVLFYEHELLGMIATATLVYLDDNGLLRCVAQGHQ